MHRAVHQAKAHKRDTRSPHGAREMRRGRPIRRVHPVFQLHIVETSGRVVSTGCRQSAVHRRHVAVAVMPACVDNATYIVPCPASYKGPCPASGWSCGDWIGWPCKGDWGLDQNAINELLRECQYSCSPEAKCTKPPQCTDDACHNTTYTLVKEHAECASDDTKIGVFSDVQACAAECAATRTPGKNGQQCEAFSFGRDDANSTDPQYADRKGMCWFEHTARARCPEVRSIQP